MSPVAVILAGGRSTRMGQDKAILRLAGQTLLARTVAVARTAGLDAVVVGRDRPDDWTDATTRFLRDDQPGNGPLGGLRDALAATNRTIVALPCDLPRLDAVAVRWLLSAADETGPGSPVVAAQVAGRVQPLFALWRQSCRSGLDAAFAAGERSPLRWMLTVHAAIVPVPSAFHAMLADCDTPGEWQRVVGPA